MRYRTASKGNVLPMWLYGRRYYGTRAGRGVDLHDPRPWYGKFAYRKGRNQ